jgi:hypothetical protein
MSSAMKIEGLSRDLRLVDLMVPELDAVPRDAEEQEHQRHAVLAARESRGVLPSGS